MARGLRAADAGAAGGAADGRLFRAGVVGLSLCAVALAAGCAAQGMTALHPELDLLRAAALRDVPPAVPDGPLSVFDAVQAALRNNPDLQAAAHRIAQAEAGLAEARAAWWPGAGVDFGYMRADAPSAYLFKRIDARSFQTGTDFNRPGTFDNFELAGTVRWNLFEGGATRMRQRLAATEHTMSGLDRVALENAMIASVIAGYYDVLAAGEMIDTAEASARTVGAQLADVRKLYEGGAAGARRADVLALEVRAAEAQEHVLQARNARELARAALAHLLGIPPDRTLDLSGDDWQPRPLPDAYEAAVQEALVRRPELEAARLAVQRAGQARRLEESAHLPRVDLVGRTWFDDPKLRYNNHDMNWTLGIVLSWDIFDGGATRAREQRARFRVEEMRSLDRKAVLSVELDVRQAFLRKEEARARLAVAQKGLLQAEESLEQAGTLYRGGAATITRYLEAELALTSARVRVTRARFDLKKASADLARAIGWCSECARKEGGS